MFVPEYEGGMTKGFEVTGLVGQQLLRSGGQPMTGNIADERCGHCGFPMQVQAHHLAVPKALSFSAPSFLYFIIATAFHQKV
jgi:hypothetical protein